MEGQFSRSLEIVDITRVESRRPHPLRLRFHVRDDRGNEIDDVPVAWEILPMESDEPPSQGDRDVPMDAGVVPDVALVGDAGGDRDVVVDANAGADLGMPAPDAEGAPTLNDAAVDGGQGAADLGTTLDGGTTSDTGSETDAGGHPASAETLQLRVLTGAGCGDADLPTVGQLDGEAEGLCLLPGAQAGSWRLVFRWPGLVQPEMLAGDGEFRLDGETRDSQPRGDSPCGWCR